LSYIEHCETGAPYQSGPYEVSLEIESYYDLIALIELADKGLSSTRAAFISAVELARSSEALFLAYRFKHLLRLQNQLRQAADQLQGPGWLEKREAETAAFVAKMDRWRTDLLGALSKLGIRS
jgi:hypothetical protein